MKKLKVKILIISALFLNYPLFAQSFMPGFDMFSRKKTAYLTLADGSKIEGQLKKVLRKKSNLSGIEIKVEKGTKSFNPSEIKEMYLPAHELNKFSVKMENATNSSKNYDLNIINEGYAFFEHAEVKLGKNVESLMMQLVNPGFSEKIKVYFDPTATETMKASVGPLSAGGVDRSYFIQLGETTVASKISKTTYKDQYVELYKSCPSLIETIGSKPDWKDFAEHIYTFENCN